MKDLLFRIRLTEAPFSNNNGFILNTEYLINSNLYFSNENYQVPFISIHEYHREGFIRYSKFNPQLRGRRLNTNRIKDIMNSSPAPLIFTMLDRKYLIGKGFLAELKEEEIDILFLACYNPKEPLTDISKVNFYVSREIYRKEHRAVSSAIKEINGIHTGDIIITSDIYGKVFKKINVGTGKTLSELKELKKNFLEKVVSISISETRKKQKNLALQQLGDIKSKMDAKTKDLVFWQKEEAQKSGNWNTDQIEYGIRNSRRILVLLNKQYDEQRLVVEKNFADVLEEGELT